MRPIVFLGAGTALDEIIEVVHDINEQSPRWQVIAALDDSESLQGASIQGVRVAGRLADWRKFPEADFIFAIGSFRTRMLRMTIIDRLGIPESRFPALIHPRAKIYPTASVSGGVIVHMNAVVLAGARLEPFSIVTFNAIVGPKVVLLRGAMVASSAVVLTGATIGSCAFIGAASCVAEGVCIGPGGMIGMGTHVFRDVAPGAFILGNPPREIRREEVPSQLLTGWNP